MSGFNFILKQNENDDFSFNFDGDMLELIRGLVILMEERDDMKAAILAATDLYEAHNG